MKLLFFFVGISCIASTIQEPQLTLNFYYEGLCPYCHEFILEQLDYGYSKLSDALKVDLIPYGKAKLTLSYNGTLTFECQHGPKECLINRIHACVLDSKPEQQPLVKFVTCHVRSASRESTEDELIASAQECAKKNNLSVDISKCTSNVDSNDLLAHYAFREAKLNPPLQFVPHIRFNDVYDADVEKHATQNLIETVCGLLTGKKPDVCNQYVKN